MYKLTTICVALSLLISGSTNAALETDTVSNSLNVNTAWLDGEKTFSWKQTWSFELPPAYVNSATLDIEAFDVSVSQGDIIPVTLDGINLGNLVQGNTNQWNTSSFSLSSSALTELTDESATISVTVPSGKQIKIRTSTLTIDYTLSTVFADYGSGTTIELSVGKGIWQLNWGQGPWTWSQSTDQPLLGPNVTGILDLHTTGPADVSADLIATLPVAGKLTLSAHDEVYKDVTIGTMVLSGTGINVIDINASRVIVDEGSGMAFAPFHPPDPKLTLTLDEATGVFAYVNQVGAWELSLAGSYAAPLVSGLELQDNILAALGGNIPVIGGIGEFALTGYYTSDMSKVVNSFCEYGDGVSLQLGAGGAIWDQNWGKGSYEWFQCDADPDAGFLDESIKGMLETTTAGAPQIDENLILTFDFAGNFALTDYDEANPEEIAGQILGDVKGTFVADMNAANAAVDEAAGTIVIAFGAELHDAPDALITITRTTGTFADIQPVGLWAWYVLGTITCARVPDLSVQDNIMAALSNNELLLGAEEEIVLTGSYYRNSP
jgi:hypothetical protein